MEIKKHDTFYSIPATDISTYTVHNMIKKELDTVIWYKGAVLPLPLQPDMINEIIDRLQQAEELLMKVYNIWNGDDDTLSSMDLLPEVTEYLHKNKLIS